MSLHQVLLVITVFTSGLAAGVFFSFTSLVIPGLMSTDARASLKGFQAIDSRLQPTASSIDWQPVFGAVVFGTGVLAIATTVLGWPHLSSAGRGLAVAAAAVYNLGFWVPTIATIVPFNNRLRDVDLDAMSPGALADLHRDFERNWRGWNLVRTASTALTFALLIAVAVIAR